MGLPEGKTVTARPASRGGPYPRPERKLRVSEGAHARGALAQLSNTQSSDRGGRRTVVRDE
jgi:hypothetical protein